MTRDAAREEEIARVMHSIFERAAQHANEGKTMAAMGATYLLCCLRDAAAEVAESAAKPTPPAGGAHG